MQDRNYLLEESIISFPGGHVVDDLIVGWALAEASVYGEMQRTAVTKKVTDEFFSAFFANPAHNQLTLALGSSGTSFQAAAPAIADVHLRDLLNSRGDLLHPHLRGTWFALAYHSWCLIAQRSGVVDANRSPAPVPFARRALRKLVNLLPRRETQRNLKNTGEGSDPLPYVRRALRELGVEASDDDCLTEIAACGTLSADRTSIERIATTFSERIHYLHLAALRRREVVRPGFVDLGVQVVADESNAKTAADITTFMQAHRIYVSAGPDDIQPSDRLLVIVSPEALDSKTFWQQLEGWRERGMEPMALCLMPRQDFYGATSSVPDHHRAAFEWLGSNVAVELTTKNDRFVPILRALEVVDPHRWWWRDDGMSLGFSLDIFQLRRGVAQRARADAAATGEPYPAPLDHKVIAGACVLAAARAATRSDATVFKPFLAREELMRRRYSFPGRPYDVAWFDLAYAVWTLLADMHRDPTRTHYPYTPSITTALLALGVKAPPANVEKFLRSYIALPWQHDAGTESAVDEQTLAFVRLVEHLSDGAIARGQRMKLAHPRRGGFVSYARADEAIAEALVEHLQANGADVWWDEDSITFGQPLSTLLESAVGGSGCLFVIASEQARASRYVQLEVDAAITRELPIVPVVLGAELPAAWRPKLRATSPNIEPLVTNAASAPANAHAHALQRLELDPAERQRWLTTGTYESLAEAVQVAREN